MEGAHLPPLLICANGSRLRPQDGQVLMMTEATITEKDRAMAQKCVECPVCSHARRTQRGLAFLFVKFIEGGFCPYCKAYEKVYGRKAHEPVPETEEQV